MTGPSRDAELVARLTELGLTVATAESLTAGAVCSRLAEVPGVSSVLRGGVVSYTNALKTDLLGVEAELLEARGAVDDEVARRMACGVLLTTGADVGLSTTGVAGPEPHQGQPVGTVWTAVAVRTDSLRRGGLRVSEDWEPRTLSTEAGPVRVRCRAELRLFEGDRAAVRAGSVEGAVGLLRDLAESVPPDHRPHG
ncbi:MAG: CinA family protein [Nesterenkonia sp.]|nr:CinA family protein [Nesterenkonia sp.]